MFLAPSRGQEILGKLKDRALESEDTIVLEPCVDGYRYRRDALGLGKCHD